MGSTLVSLSKPFKGMINMKDAVKEYAFKNKQQMLDILKELCGIPCIDSIGVEGERAHSVEEYGVISSLAQSAKRIASIICGI